MSWAHPVERGLRVDVWTIDSEPDMRRLLGYGVDGIMTDRSEILAKVLEASETDGTHTPTPS
jgi:glycerophosphoryl diester phosphodiesterase